MCMLVVVPPGNPMFHAFDDVLSSISDAVTALGGTVTVELVHPGMQWTHACAQDGRAACRHVVLGANILAMPAYKDMPPPPPDFAIYNLEQVGDTAWFGAGSLALLRSHVVWEYSTRNAVKLAELGVATTPMPVGFGRSMVAVTKAAAPAKDIDVLLIGTCHQRRCHVLQQLNDRGYVARIAGGECPPALDACNAIRLPVAFGAERDVLLARARVILNVHYFEAGVFEVARVSYLVANHHFVVSERGNDPGLEATYEGALVFADTYDALPDTVAQWLAAGEQARAEVAQRGFSIVSRQRLESFVRCPVFSRPTRRHVRVEFEGEPAWPVTPSRLHPGAPQGDANRRPSCAALRRGHADLLADAGEPVTPLMAFAGDPRLHPPQDFRVVAILAGFNEADVIPSSVRDYLRQGISVHYIDNWSTDSTMEVLTSLQTELEAWKASGGVSPGWLGRLDGAGCDGVPAPDVTLTFEVFPKERPRFYNWGALLDRKVAVARQMPSATWFIHSDPDEIRESPWGPAVPLRQALFVAQAMGYNFVNFARFQTFTPVAPGPQFDGTKDDMRSFFEYREAGGINVDRTLQIKAWRRGPAQATTARGAEPWVNLTAMGGHFAFYQTDNPGGAGAWNAVFPWLFTLRHYPMRGAAHGIRKVLKERFGRWSAEERKNGWHTQYDAKIMEVLGLDCDDSGPPGVCMLAMPPGGFKFTPEQEQAIATELKFVHPKEGMVRAPHGDLPSSFYEQELPCVPDTGVLAAMGAARVRLDGDEADEWLRREGPQPCGVWCRVWRFVKRVDDQWLVFKRGGKYMFGELRPEVNSE